MCVLIEVFKPFTFNVFVGVVEFTSPILLFISFFVLPVFVPLLLFP